MSPQEAQLPVKIFLDGIEHYGVRFGIGKPCVFTLQCNRKLFGVALIPGDIDPDSASLRYGFDPGLAAPKYRPSPGLLQGYHPAHAIEGDYLRKLDTGITESGTLDETGNQTFTQIHNLVLTTAEPLIREHAGIPVEPTGRETLEEALNPETFWPQIVTIDEKLAVIRHDDVTAPRPAFEPQEISGISSTLPITSWSQVEVLETIRPKRAYKVQVEAQVRFCKVTGRGYELPSISRDTQVLQRITDAGLDRSVNIPRLEGLVDQAASGGVIGILTSFRETRVLGETLESFQEPIETVVALRREKWLREIKEATERLHQAGLVWGDAAPRNVLIDQQDNAWIVDFGGGFNWDIALMDTEAGDYAGLREIAQYLQMEY